METILMLAALVVLILLGGATGCCTLPSRPSESFGANYARGIVRELCHNNYFSYYYNSIN